jgi:SAM-dependent methyltransferase
VFGRLADREFQLSRCRACGFAFVADPLPESQTTFDYYGGAGADPLVDYVGEIEYPAETIRIYEWRGLLKVIAALVPLSPQTQWLDFGCGTGGLVRHCRAAHGFDIVGYEQGEGARLAGSAGTPMVDTSQLDALRGTFDVITAIEVLEHLVDPLTELARIRSLLADGGVFFYTTGNAAPYRNRLNRWRYVIPEIHVSFFEPRTLELALRKTGFVTDFRGFLPGFDDVIRFKILKNLGRKRRSPLEALVPWHALARVVDRRFGITAHPIGWAA